MITWGDLHPGDLIKARAGSVWRVDRWEPAPRVTWLAAGGGGSERVFTLSPVDGSRAPITAPHRMSDPVDRVFQYDRSEQADALTALGAAFQLDTISEGEAATPMAQTTVHVQLPGVNCPHPAEKRSTLKDGAIFCTECLGRIGHTTDPVLDQQLGEAAGLDQLASTVEIVHPPQCSCPRPECVALFGPPRPAPAPVEVPPYLAVDSTGIEYTIPARDRIKACAAGIHPVNLLGPVVADAAIGPARACSACSLVVPVDPGLDNGHHVSPAGLVQMGTAEATAAAIGGVVAPAWLNDALIESATAIEDGTHLVADAFTQPTEPVAPVAPAVAVTVTTDRPAGPPDLFSDPAAHIEVKRDRWKRYLLPDPITGEEKPWTRASTLARAMADEYHLTRWKMRTAARGTAISKDLIAGFAAADPDDKVTLNSLTEKAMERAESSSGATFGTALHNFTHRLDRGEPLASLRAPDPLGADLIEYQATLQRHGLTVVPGLIERIVICPTLGAAGTFDRFIQQRPGPGSQCPLSVFDLKTAKSVDWSWLEIAVQLAIYGNASYMWDPVSRTYTELPGRDVLDRDRALVLHLPVGKATGTLYGVNIIEGWEAAQTAEIVRQYRNGSKGYGWLVNPVDPQSLLLHRVSQADGPELARLWDTHYPRGEWTDAVANAAALRVARLGAVPA